jgi:Amino acid transporters
MTAPSGLARKSIGTGSLLFFCVGASAPMTVIAGSVVQTYAITGVLGVPLSFLVLAAALALFTVGYAAMTRYVPHAATFYALLARGLGRIWGMAGGTVALVTYNSIQICLYGLLGFMVSTQFGYPWWVWALLAWIVVGLLGVLHININARVLTILLICEIGVILLFDFASFTHPAHGMTVRPLAPTSLFGSEVGGVFALSIAAFVGYESGPFYGEEARGPHVVARASFGALAFIGVLYAVSSWAMAVAVGVDPVATDAGQVPEVVAATRNPDSGIPFSIIDMHYGGLVAGLASILLITSILAAMISFHNSVARYVFGMARERVLPARLGSIRPGSRGGAPIGGSILQSAVAFIVVLPFVLADANPLLTLFTWLSIIAALGVMLLMFGSSLAVVGFFRRVGGSGETPWQRIWAPFLGAGALAVIFMVTFLNLGSLLGPDAGPVLTWSIPGVVLLALVVGLVWGRVLQTTRPETYRNIGVGEQEPLAVLEHALADIKV